MATSLPAIREGAPAPVRAGAFHLAGQRLTVNALDLAKNRSEKTAPLTLSQAERVPGARVRDPLTETRFGFCGRLAYRRPARSQSSANCSINASINLAVR